MKSHKTFATLVIMVLSLFMLPQTEAQLLKKLSKGLEKINKTVEQVDKTLNKNNPKSEAGTANTGQNTASEATEVGGWDEDMAENTDGSEEMVAQTATPYLTSETLFLEATPYNVSNVSEGVFSVKRGERYEFWKIDGKKLFDANWESCTPAFVEPEFHDGVVAMRKPAQGYKPGNVCLLYIDGRVKDIGNDIFAVTNFMDGAAVVWPSSNSSQSYYIDTTGKKIYTAVTVDGGQPGCIRPLKDGLRAFPKSYNEWGYMDANGAIKLAPKYKSATDFSEGYAWVVMPDNTKHLIDKTGKSVFQAPEWDSKTCAVVDGRFFVERGSKTCYYDIQGNMLKIFEYGTAFFDGYAFVTDGTGINGLLINKNMDVVKSFDYKVIDSSMVLEQKMRFNKNGLTVVGSGDYIMKPDGRIILSEFYNPVTGTRIDGFRSVSDDDYIVAQTIAVDNDMNGAAILKPSGEVVWVISEQPEYSVPISNRLLPYRGVGLNANGQFTIKTVNIHQAPIGPKM